MVLSCGFALFRGQKIVEKREKMTFFENGYFLARITRISTDLWMGGGIRNQCNRNPVPLSADYANGAG
jgi:hypothetical protein